MGEKKNGWDPSDWKNSMLFFKLLTLPLRVGKLFNLMYNCSCQLERSCQYC